jgi:hypothetical protein
MFSTTFSDICKRMNAGRSGYWQRQGLEKRLSDPPDPKEKAAGKAGTLHSGTFNSLAAISSFYDIPESRASQKLVGGAK